MNRSEEQSWIDMPLGSVANFNIKGRLVIIRVPGGWVVNNAFVPEKPTAELRERYFGLMEKMAEQK